MRKKLSTDLGFSFDRLAKSLLLIVSFLFLNGNVWGQTTVFSDDFTTVQSDTYTTSGVIGTSSWSVNRSGADWGGRRSTLGQLDITNDASATNNASGWGFANISLSSFSSPFSSILNSNSGLVTWTFNFRTNRTSALAGFSSNTSYGMGCVLVGTSATAATSGTGYAVVMGGGTNNNIALIKYSSGLQGTRTTIIGYGNTPTNLTDYISVKVTYNPTDNTWNLYTRDDGTSSFSDPSTGTLTQIGTSIVDNTYTSTAMSFLGAYWQGSTAATQFATFDNYKVTVASAATCSSPASPMTTNITSSSVTLGWNAPTPAPASGYQYYLSTGNTAPDSSTTPTGSVASGTSANVSVSANTTYYWWVRSNCSASDKSSWVSGGNFTTPCAATALPVTEGFNTAGTAVFPSCWTSQSTDSSPASITFQTSTSSTPAITPQEGTRFAYWNSYSITNGKSTRLVSKPLSSTGISDVQVDFYWYQSSNGASSYQTEGVQVQYSLDGVSWVDAGSFIKRYDATATGWTLKSVYLPNAVGNQSTFYVGFKFVSNNGYDSGLDNVTIKQAAASTTVSTTSLTGFAATTASDSAQQSFIVSGNTLGSSNITITPSAGYQISTTSGSGYTSTPIVLTPTSGTVANTTIYVVLKKSVTTGAANGSITVSSPPVTPDKTVSLTGTISKATFTSIGNGNWESASTWDLNAIPGSADNVVIAAAHIVTATTSQTRDSGTTTTVAGILATNASYLNNGTTTINGTFQINDNGWGGGSADFVYGSAGNLIFNHNNGSEYGSIDATHRYWPATSGPVNVTINSNSPVNLGVARTVNGILQVSAGFRNLGNITIGTNGTLKLNSGYSWLNSNSSPIYGTSSTLIYNSGGSPGRSNEWTASTGTVGTTAGLPQNVQISNNTTINFPNGSTNNFRVNGILTIDNGSSLYQNFSGGSAGLIVGGNLVLNGNLGLGSNEGGDITVGGNWTQAAAANFYPNGRKAIFNGNVAQTIQKVGGGAIDFDRLEINKTNTTNVAISNSTGNLTDININGTTSNVLSITGSGTGSLNLQNRTLTFNNNGGFIYVDATKAITASTGAIINVNGSKAVANNSGTGTLSFPSQVTINLNQNGVFDFGKSTDYISTVNGTVNINHSSAYVNTNPPIYATGSKLVYRSGGTYARRIEWSTTAGAGYPYDVQVTNNTTLNYPNTGSGAFSTALGIARDLNIDSGSSLYMDYGNGGNKSGSLTVGRNIVNTGNLSLGDFAGGDLSLGGSWTSAGTFIPNNRAVTFMGGDASVYPQKINSATTFDYLTINEAVVNYVELGASIVVNKDLTLTNKNIDLKGFNITLPNKSSNITSSAASYLTATGAGKLVRQGIDGTKDWIFPLGATASGRYAPITIKNLSGTTDLSINVNTAITPTVSDATRVLSTKWFVTTTSNVTANIYAEWQGITAETNNMTIPATGSLATTVGGAPYTFYNVNLVANNTTATGVSLSNTAANGIVIGNDNAIKLTNDDCSGAVNVILDAPAISGSNAGATNSLAAINCNGTSSVALDVWYKFTTTNTGTYKIDATSGTIGDLVLDLRSGACNGTNIACSDSFTSTGTESISILLDANTTYYYRIYKYGSGSGTFTTSVSTVPTIIVNPTTLAYGNVTYNTTSDKTFTVKGNFLNPPNDNLSIAALSGYEYSLDGVTYSTTLTLPYTSKTLTETTVHVRFHPTSACTDYNGNIVISGGGATSVNIAATGKGVIQSPGVNNAKDITTNSFIANWSAVNGVTTYELDVYTKGTVSNTLLNATFDDVNGTGGNSGGWNGNIAAGTIPSAYTTAGWSFSNSSGADKSIKAGSGSNLGVVTTPELAISNTGILTFRAGAWDATSESTTLKLSATNATLDLATVTLVKGSFSTYTVQISNITGNVKISFTGNNSSNSRFFIDDIKVVTSGIGNIPISGSPFTISDPITNKLITGLTQGQTYYYKVRGVNGNCKSSDSDEKDVTTNNTVIWNNNAWTNTNGPDINLDAIIRSDYTVGENGQGDFTAKSLTVESTGSLEIKANHGITVAGSITTPDNKIIIDSDGSLLQTDNNAVNSNNKVTAKRDVHMKTSDYTYWSSPVEGQPLRNTATPVGGTTSPYFTTGGFSAGTPNNRIYRYNEPDDTFKATDDANFVFAKGYAIRGKADWTSMTNATLAFSGSLHNGEQNITLQKSKKTTIKGTDYEHGYNLVGNPYPSNIDFLKLYNLDDNKKVIFGKAWFWTNVPGAPATQGGSAYTPNNYAILSLAGGVGATATVATGVDNGVGTPTPNQYIKVAQGFIVQLRIDAPVATQQVPNPAPVTKDLKFDNSIRTNDSSGYFYNNNKVKDSGINRYWVRLISPYNIVNTILVAHMNETTNQYDPDYDAELLSIGDDSFYSKLGTQKLQIQARNNPLSDDDAISLGTKYSTNGTYKIALAEKEGVFSEDQKIYLHDKLLDKYVDLTVGNYSFNASKGTDENRFEIVYKNKEVLGADNITSSDFRVYRDENYFVIKSSKILGKVEVYDAGGRLIRSINSSSKEAKLDGNLIPSGVYIIKAENSGSIRTKKIIK